MNRKGIGLGIYFLIFIDDPCIHWLPKIHFKKWGVDLAWLIMQLTFSLEALEDEVSKP